MNDGDRLRAARGAVRRTVRIGLRWAPQAATLAAVLIFTACQAPPNTAATTGANGGAPAGTNGGAPANTASSDNGASQSGASSSGGAAASGTSSASESGANGSASGQDVARLEIPKPPAAPQPRLPAKPIAEQLDGLIKARVVDRFGVPDFRRREATAEIWQYRGTRCTIDVFFDGRDGGAKVIHVDVRSLGVSKLDDDDCLADIGASRPSS